MNLFLLRGAIKMAWQYLLKFWWSCYWLYFGRIIAALCDIKIPNWTTVRIIIQSRKLYLCKILALRVEGRWPYGALASRYRAIQVLVLNRRYIVSCSWVRHIQSFNATIKLSQWKPVVSHTSRFAYIEVVSPTRPWSIRIHRSRFAYIEKKKRSHKHSNRIDPPLTMFSAINKIILTKEQSIVRSKCSLSGTILITKEKMHSNF